jgi:hypothetical protein
MTEHEIIVKHLRRISTEAYVVGAVVGSVLGIGLGIRGCHPERKSTGGIKGDTLGAVASTSTLRAITLLTF